MRAARARGRAPRAWSPPRVTEVREGSPCAGAVREGDLLLEINGRTPLDVIDVMLAGAEPRLRLRLRRGGREISRAISKPAEVPLGLVLDEAVFDGVRGCANRCVFCFVDQMPPGLRASLYLKDDDYRLSFYYGNFITLNNLAPGDLERITRLRIAPLYVSLHSTDPALRSSLMGGEARRGLEALDELLRAGLEVHLQVVVCPGLNDGRELRRTLGDVLERYPGAASLAVVPVGLTRYAHRLPARLRAHDRDSAAAVLDLVEEFRSLARERTGSRLFHAADEFYILAGRTFPAEEEYEGYPQLENGVGMARKFLEEAARAQPRGTAAPARGALTGALGETVLREALGRAGVARAETVGVRNLTFGDSVTVSGLLAGGDIAAALKESRPACAELLLPENALREGRFLDDLTPREVEEATGYRLVPCPPDGEEFLRLLCGEGGRGAWLNAFPWWRLWGAPTWANRPWSTASWPGETPSWRACPG